MSNLERRVADLEARTRFIPSRFGVNLPAPIYFLECGSGNVLQTLGATSYYGLKRPASAVLTVPSVIPPAGICPDGLTRATLIANDGSTSYVWAGVRLQPGATVIDEYAGVLSDLTPFVARTIVQMPMTGDPATLIPVYAAWRIC